MQGEATIDDRRADPFAYYEKEVNRSWEMGKCYFSYHGTDDLHYTNVPLLSMFLSKFGNILPRTQTHLSAKMQRKLARTIKTSRQAGLLPYKGTWFSIRCVADYFITLLWWPLTHSEHWRVVLQNWPVHPRS